MGIFIEYIKDLDPDLETDPDPGPGLTKTPKDGSVTECNEYGSATLTVLIT